MATSELPKTDALSSSPPENEKEAKKAPATILRAEIIEGIKALERPALPLVLSGLSAGLDIGFSLFLMAVIWTRTSGQLSPAAMEFLLGSAYVVGFIFVILGRSELFTEQTTLAVLPVLNRQAPLWRLGRLWILVFISNLIGAAGSAFVSAWIGPVLGIIDPLSLLAIAHRALDHSGDAIFLSGILAGWLMGLLSWLVAAGRDTISQIAVVWLITFVIGFCNLNHVVVGSVEVFAGFMSSGDISFGDVIHFLGYAAMGNVVGGSVFVAFIKFGHARG